MNVLLSGVEGCSGPDGAKENSPVAFLLDSGVALDAPKEKGLGAATSSSPLPSSFPEITSSTIFVTSADGFFGVATGAGVEADTGLAPPKENGDDEPPAVGVGVKPPKVGVDVDELLVEGALGRANPPTEGGAGNLSAADPLTGAVLLLASPLTADLLTSGLHPAFFADASRCCSYCFNKPGRAVERSTKGSDSIDWVRNEMIEVLRPRSAV